MVEYEKDPPGGAPGRVKETARVPYVVERETEWIPAAEFKTHCLRLIETVRQERTEVVVTRYGKPVARLVPYAETASAVFGHLAGTVLEHGDLVSPTDETWEADA